MLTRDEVYQVLRFGFVESFTYGDPKPFLDIKFEDAKREVENRSIACIDESIEMAGNDSFVPISGGLDSTLLVSRLKGKRNTYSLIVEGNEDEYFTKRVVEKYKTNHISFNASDIPLRKMFIDYQRHWSKPRHYAMGEIFTAYYYYLASQITDKILSGVGTDLMFSYAGNYNSIYESIKRGEYNYFNALKYKNNGKFFKENSRKSIGHIIKNSTGRIKYEKIILTHQNFIFYFNDNEFKELELKSCNPKLRKDNILHYNKFFEDWYTNRGIFKREDGLSDKYKVKVFAPFRNKKIKDFCLNLPIEMSSCIGCKRFIYKEAIGNLVPVEYVTRSPCGCYPNGIWLVKVRKEFNSIIDEFLGSPDMSIYSYLPYKIVQRFINEYKNIPDNIILKYTHSLSSIEIRKMFRLINLSIWLEIQNGL